jgi:hypothetical protein
MFLSKAKAIRFLGFCILFLFGIIQLPERTEFAAIAAGSPAISWNTFLGGTSRDESYANALDKSGNIYVAGRSKYNWGMPTRRHNGGTADAFVTKLGSHGEVLWNAFLGSSAEDFALGVAVGNTGLYVAGMSTKNWGAPIRSYTGMYDAFVAKLSFDGDLLWNTFLGTAGIDGAAGIACDSNDNIYVTGISSSSWGKPVNGFSSGISTDGFVAKLNSDGAMVWNTFFGSGDYDISLGLTLDGAGNVYIAGVSKSTWGNPVRAQSGGDDAVIVKLDCLTGNILWNTFLGSSKKDQAIGVASDPSGGVIVVGRSNASWGSPLRAYGNNMNAFAAKISNSGTMAWNTFLGSNSNPSPEFSENEYYPFITRGEVGDLAIGVAVDTPGNIYITGASSNSWGSPASPHSKSDLDSFTAKLDKNGLLQWNAFAGRMNAFSAAISLDHKGGIYIAGKTNYADFTEMTGDAFITKFSE